MVTIIERTNSKGVSKLYAYAKNKNVQLVTVVKGVTKETDGLNTKISLGMEMSHKDWEKTNKHLQSFIEAKKNGEEVVSAPKVVLQLWQVKDELSKLEKSGRFDTSVANGIIQSILHPEEAQETTTSVAHANTRPTSFLDYMQQFIDKCKNGERLTKKKGKEHSHASISSYESALAILKDFAKQKHYYVIKFTDINSDFLSRFTRFVTTSRGSKRNTAKTYIVRFKNILRLAKNEGYEVNEDFENFNIATEETDNIYLNESQISELYDFDFTDKELVAKKVSQVKDKDEKEYLSRHLIESKQANFMCNQYAKCRDAFILGCLTGQRYSDFKRINQEMIKGIDGTDFIEIRQEKTEKKVFVPIIDKRIKEILTRNDGRVYALHLSDMNERLRHIAALVGWDHNAGIEENVNGVRTKTTKKFYECISTHSARRSWATNAYKRGVPLRSIMAVTGHGTEEMLRRYLKLTQEEAALAAARDLAKFMGMIQ